MISNKRQELFGIGAIAVLLAHSCLIVSVPRALSILLGNGAIWAVRMFFFLSGVGLVWSTNKNSLKIKDYYNKRINRVIIPFLSIAPIFYFWQELIINFRPIRFLTKVSLLDYWIFGGGHVWYLAVLIPLYILFPLLYHVLGKGKDKFIIVIILWIVFDLIAHIVQPNYCRMIENAFTSVFAFMVGVLFADKADNITRGGYVAVFLGIISFPIASILTDGNNIVVRYCGSFVGICMTYLFALLLQKLNIGVVSTILSAIGAYSLELYITNVFVIELVNYYFGFFSPVIRLSLILIMGVIMSILLKWISNRIIRIKNRRYS